MPIKVEIAQQFSKWRLSRLLRKLFQSLSVHIFSMPSQLIIIITQSMFSGPYMFWALLRAHFNLRLTARGMMTLCREGTLKTCLCPRA